jgi:hypothetical protein
MLAEMSDWLALLGGIVLTQVLFLSSQFYRESEGYMLRAVRKLWPFLLTFLIVEWVVGLLFFHLLHYIQWLIPVPIPLLAFIAGVIVAAIPTALEGILLPKDTKIETLNRRLTKLLLKLNIALRHNYAWAIESCRQQDVYDCQEENSWGLGINPQTTGRRLRIIYEFEKVRIAERRKDSSFLRYDEGYTPWSKLYLLVRHLGRKRLREVILHPPTLHCRGWDGQERRKKRELGSKEDRLNLKERANPRCRLYDDTDLLKRIDSGERIDSLKKEPAQFLPYEPGEEN